MAPKKGYSHKLHIENALNSLHLMMSLTEGPSRPGIIKGQVRFTYHFAVSNSSMMVVSRKFRDFNIFRYKPSAEMSSHICNY